MADISKLHTRTPGDSQRPRLNGFGDADGFGDAGSFDLGGFGRRRSDRSR